LALLFVDAQHAPNAMGMVGGTAGLGDGDRLVVLGNLAVNSSAARDEQTQKVIGLEVMRSAAGSAD
jgi:hypothetical protein